MLTRLLAAAGGSGGFTIPAYTGTLSVGAISTITDDTKYNAWPVICAIANGDLLVGYTKADTHHLDNTGKGVIKISSDSGATWGSEVTVYDDSTLWVALYGLFQASTGRIFASLWRDDHSSSSGAEAGMSYSDDNGATWSGWSTLTTTFTKNAYTPGPVIELPNGDLLVTIEGDNTGQSDLDNSSHTLRSSDNGATWGAEVTVRDFVTDTRPYYESKLVRLSNNDLLCVHRTAANAPGTHYISKSTDNGLTWGAPVSQFAGFGAPSTIRRFTNTLISITRRNSDSACIAYTSIDNGTTWGSAVVLDATMNEMEYGCPVDLNDGRCLVVYGSQPTSSTSNADIKQVYLTET